MNDKLKPALIGGVALGILSAIPFVSTCCCLWALLGGLLATYLYVKNSPAPASVGQKAVRHAGGVSPAEGSPQPDRWEE